MAPRENTQRVLADDPTASAYFEPPETDDLILPVMRRNRFGEVMAALSANILPVIATLATIGYFVVFGLARL